MVKYGFFNAKKLITGDYDRKYNAEDVNAYFKGTISKDGIYQFVGNQCRVIPAGNMNVAVRDGKGQINYHWFEVTANEVLTIREAHATLNRYTAIVARYDAANRNIYLLTIDGTESERPSKPQLQKTDTLRDICLAYVYVAAGATEITRDDIEDAVEDIEVCGFVETLLTSKSAVIRVRQLPIPSKSCQGNIYYLIEESKTAGKSYIKGYYYCEPSRTEYDFIDFDWTSDALSNRPVASVDYLDILFFANDNNKWYRCVEVSENTYEWQEVVVNVVEELPEPTEDINNQFYIIGNTLYKVAKQESNYKWYMFGTGSGGGHGDFAIMRIEYPEGTEVQVTFDGDTVDAPDTSGVWIYGCDAAGTYVVGIKNTSATKEVEITTAGQVENVYISPQVINYKLLYYIGNEFASPIAEEKEYAISTGGWGNLKNIDMSSFSKNACETIYSINTKNYSQIFAYYAMTTNASGHDPSFDGTYVGNGINVSDEKVLDTIYIYEQPPTGGIRHFIMANVPEVDNSIAIGNKIFGGSSYGTAYHNLNKLSTCIEFKSQFAYPSHWQQYDWYCIGLCKNDNILCMADYGTTISEILANSVALFEDENVLNAMVISCTGDFMISALSNSNFINAMNASPNKTILTANEHWARFIALLSV